MTVYNVWNKAPEDPFSKGGDGGFVDITGTWEQAELTIWIRDFTKKRFCYHTSLLDTMSWKG